MAKNKSRRQDVNPVSDPKSEELRQRILESQYQMQLEEEGQRLKQIQEQAESSKLRNFLLLIGILPIFILVLYIIIRKHCFVDLPLFVILAVVAIWLMGRLFVKNQELCNRISEILGERGLN